VAPKNFLGFYPRRLHPQVSFIIRGVAPDTCQLGGCYKRQDFVAIFRQIFNACVSDRLQAGASGLMLSGGIDSSTVLGACLAVRGNVRPFLLSVSFNDPDLVMSQDEQLIEAMRQQLQLPHQFLHADAFLRLPDVADINPYIDGPDASASPLIRQVCAGVLQRQGVSLVMTGEGGDVVLGEAMHWLILDAIRKHDGIEALHHYISRNLGAPFMSVEYLRMLASSIFHTWGQYERRIRLNKEDSLPHSPQFLTAKQVAATKSAAKPIYPWWRKSRQFPYIGHEYMHSVLFPRAAYFDSLNVQCTHSHPFLDPRMIAFALTCPPHVQHDYSNLDRNNPYATSKMLARQAYRDQLPAFVCDKTHKTSYAQMARRMFSNSAAALYKLTQRPMLAQEWDLIDQACFTRHLMAYIVSMDDPNANPGLQFHYIRGVADMEGWLMRFTGPREQIKKQLRIQALQPIDV